MLRTTTTSTFSVFSLIKYPICYMLFFGVMNLDLTLTASDLSMVVSVTGFIHWWVVGPSASPYPLFWQTLLHRLHIVDIGLDFGTCRVNELLLPKALILRLHDPAFAPFPVRQNSSTMGRSGVWLSEAIFYACHKEHLPDTGRLFLVSPLGITTLGPDCHSQNNCRANNRMANFSLHEFYRFWKSLRQYRPSGTVENFWNTMAYLRRSFLSYNNLMMDLVAN